MAYAECDICVSEHVTKKAQLLLMTCTVCSLIPGDWGKDCSLAHLV